MVVVLLTLLVLSSCADSYWRASEMSLPAGLKKYVAIAAFVAVWLPAMAFGFKVLWKYSTTPGHAGTPPVDWPAGAPIARGKGRATLVMFAHPQCDCSRATLGELAILMARAGGELDADVFFYLPAHEASTWARTGLWRSASAIPGVRVFEDRDAAVAQSFGAFTSGQTLLYNGSGRLLFKGGITAFRGHSGDNDGRTAITALLRDEAPRNNSLPIVTRVFGCNLRGE
jgi:hypothetical protein